MEDNNEKDRIFVKDISMALLFRDALKKMEKGMIIYQYLHFNVFQKKSLKALNNLL